MWLELTLHQQRTASKKETEGGRQKGGTSARERGKVLREKKIMNGKVSKSL